MSHILAGPSHPSPAFDFEEGVHVLPGGRQLAWASAGSGPVVIWCHGSNSGRLDLSYVAPANGSVRVVAFDRPGMGRSTRAKGRTLIDGARDIESLADGLNINEFAVLGYSMGGPYALVAGAILSDRVTAVGSVAGNPPLDEDGLAALPGPAPLFRVARDAGAAAVEQAIAGLYPMTSAKLDGFLTQFDGLVDGDYLRQHPDVRRILHTVTFDSAQQGPGGFADDKVACVSDWGINWSDLHNTPVVIWQGEDDPLVTPAAASLIARRVPHADVRLVPGCGHYGWISEMPSIVETLADISQRTAATQQTTTSEANTNSASSSR